MFVIRIIKKYPFLFIYGKVGNRMSLKLMYITNRPEIAKIAESAGVDRIFVDMEYIGKDLRQGGMDSVQNHHTVDDVRNIKSVLTRSKLLVRINPIHEASADYCSSEEEINSVIEAGADIIMLPYFKTTDDVETFLKMVSGRVKTMLLLETSEAVNIIDDIIKIPGIDEIHIGLNDLHLSYGLDFMFELLTNGTVELLCKKIGSAGIKYGFGGVAKIGYGAVPAEMIILEHYRLGTSMTILSRSFCDYTKISTVEQFEKEFTANMKELREFESKAAKSSDMAFSQNQKRLKIAVDNVAQIIRKSKKEQE